MLDTSLVFKCNSPPGEESMQVGSHRMAETLLAADNHHMRSFGPCFVSFTRENET